MMDQKNWEKLFEAFQNENVFEEEDGIKYANECDFEDLNLFEWLECGSYGPSMRMKEACARHGYDIFCIERDSFGWLIGGIRQMLIPDRKVITFG